MTAKNELISMQHFIGGEWTDAENAAVFDDFNPLDDSLYGRAAKGTSADMQSAIAAARGAFPAYKASLPLERERWLLRVAELMEERQKELVDCLIDEIGSPVQKAMFKVQRGLTMVRAAAGVCRYVRVRRSRLTRQASSPCLCGIPWAWSP